MKVILTQEVEKLGDAHEIVDVADGYARNYLLPRSLAVVATRSALANIDNMRRVGERRNLRLRGAAQATAGQLEGKTVVIPARLGAKGRLYGSVGNADIAEQLEKDHGIAIDRKQITVEEPIRSIGIYSVPVTLFKDVKVQLTVQVGEDAAAAAAATAAETAPATPEAAEATPSEGA
jgi:large subunit ribosomal protein L9